MNNSSSHPAGVKPTNPLPFSFIDLRAKVLNIFIWGAATACILEVYLFWGRTLPIFTELLITAFLLLLVIALAPIPYPIRVWTLLSIYFGLALHEIYQTGIFGNSHLFLLAFMLAAGILLDRKGFWITLGVSVVPFVVMGWLNSIGALHPADQEVTIGRLSSWIAGTLLMVLVAFILEEGWKRLQSEYFVTQATLKNAMNTLSNERVNLETRVSERIQETVTNGEFQKKRADRYHLIDEIIRTIDGIQDPEELMRSAVQQIREKFGFYHVGIYLNDENNSNIVLRAAHGAGSDKLLSRGTRLKIDQSGFIGYVAASGLPRIAKRAKDDILFISNPDLPETRSVLALPLLKGQRTIGVMDLESNSEGGLSDQDLEVMGTLANQVSIAIGNAQSLSETRQALSEARVVYGHYMRQAWEQLATERRTVGYRYSASKVNPLDAPLDLPEIQSALQSGRPVTSSEEKTAVTFPLKLRDEVIGVLDIRSNNPDRQWNENEMVLIQAIADRVSLALENARLFEETTRRADRERTVSEITTHIRSTTDPQAMLKTALEELKHALGAKDIRIHPYSPPTTE